jgi:hypothetical protein
MVFACIWGTDGVAILFVSELLERGSKYKKALTPHFTEVTKIRVIWTQSIRTS